MKVGERRAAEVRYFTCPAGGACSCWWLRAAGVELLRTEGAAGEVSAALPASPEVPAAEKADSSGGSANDKELLNKYIAGESG